MHFDHVARIGVSGSLKEWGLGFQLHVGKYWSALIRFGPFQLWIDSI